MADPRYRCDGCGNLTRFDVQSVSTSLTAGSFGNYSGLLTNPRVMQFALRYQDITVGSGDVRDFSNR